NSHDANALIPFFITLVRRRGPIRNGADNLSMINTQHGNVRSKCLLTPCQSLNMRFDTARGRRIVFGEMTDLDHLMKNRTARTPCFWVTKCPLSHASQTVNSKSKQPFRDTTALAVASLRPADPKPAS